MFQLATAAASKVHSYPTPTLMWVILGAIAVVFIAIEVHHMKRDHEIGMSEATRYSVFYIGLAMAFGIPVILTMGGQAGSEYYAAWAIEKALSLDNLFVMGLIFTAFNVPKALERRMLNYGIAGAIVFRLIFIVAGLEFIKRFQPAFVIFGGILALGAWKALKSARGGEDDHMDPRATRTWRFMQRHANIADNFDGHKFRTVQNGVHMLTLMLPVIIIIEIQDVIFAVDSVPAVLAVSPDRFIAFSSNLMAILGLRALFFVYQNVASKFWAMSWGVSIILGWIAFKMIVTPDELMFGIPWFGLHIPVAISLGVLAVLLFGSIAVSLAFPRKADLAVPHVGVVPPDKVTPDKTN